MSLSVTELGQKFNVNGKVINYILKTLGYLTGEPGDYSLTDKGAIYASEKHYHRGTGGYATYNRYWTTRRWDESIIKELHITPEIIEDATKALVERKKQITQCIQAVTEETCKSQQLSNTSKNVNDINKNNNYLIVISKIKI